MSRKSAAEVKANIPALRVAAFDIECTNLEASYGRTLCVCFKFSDEAKPRTVTARWLRDEPKLLETVGQWWDEADIVAGWNSKLFDQRFLNARRMFYGMLPLDPTKMHKDLMFEFRKLRFRGSRLEGASKDLRTKAAKFDVPAYRWLEAAEGQQEALNLIVKHCQLDVLLTEEMFTRLKPLITNFTR